MAIGDKPKRASYSCPYCDSYQARRIPSIVPVVLIVSGGLMLIGPLLSTLLAPKLWLGQLDVVVAGIVLILASLLRWDSGMAGCAACNKTFEIPKVRKLGLRCPNCNKKLKGATSEMVGDIGVCPRCGTEFEIKENGIRSANISLSSQPPLARVASDRITGTSTVEPEAKSAIHSDESGQESFRESPFAWRFLRVTSVLLFLICSTMFGGFLFIYITLRMHVPKYPPLPYIGSYLLGLIIALLLALGFLFLAKWWSQKASPIPALPELSSTRLMGAILIAAALFCLGRFRVLPETSETIRYFLEVSENGGYFLCFCLGTALLIHRKVFSWRNYAVVGLVFAIVSGGISYERTARVIVEVRAGVRQSSFQDIVAQCTPLVDDEKLASAIRSASDTPIPPMGNGSLLVLRAGRSPDDEQYQLGVSPYEAFIPDHLLARHPSEVRWVVVIGPVGPVTRRTVAPLLVPIQA